MELGCEVARGQIAEPSRAAVIQPPLAELAPGVSAAGKLDRADIDALAQKGVRTIINNRPDGEDPGQLPAAEARRPPRRTASPITTSRSPPRPDPRRCRRVCRGVGQGASSRSWCIAAAAPARRLLWALVRMREGADPFALIGEAARHGIDIAALPAIAARLR